MDSEPNAMQDCGDWAGSENWWGGIAGETNQGGGARRGQCLGPLGAGDSRWRCLTRAAVASLPFPARPPSGLFF